MLGFLTKFRHDYEDRVEQATAARASTHGLRAVAS
jgi:hypothetical protein